MDDAVKQRAAELVGSSSHLTRTTEYGTAFDNEQLQGCQAWIAAALNLIELICPSKEAAYRRQADRIVADDYNQGGTVMNAVGALAGLLELAIQDIDNGLLHSLENSIRAETFDTFLDHADHYLENGSKDVAGVIAGVAFEDTIRRMVSHHGIADEKEKLDTLISALARQGVISGLKAKNARADAGLRTSATHAQWDQFEEGDVRRVIDHTRELIRTHLDK